MAAMRGERGAEKVIVLLNDACISAVNLSEVVAKLVERQVAQDDIFETLAELELDVRPFDAQQAVRAGLLRERTREYGLSSGDRACLELAATLDRSAITTDKAWANLDIGIPVELIR